jgi:hypothetical protein
LLHNNNYKFIFFRTSSDKERDFELKKSIIRIFTAIGLFVICVFIIFVINQTVQVINLITNVHPLLGQISFFVLLIIYAILLLVPVIIYFRLPKALKPPDDDHSAELTIYLEKLAKRLLKNQYLKDYQLKSRRDIEEALKFLGAKSNDTIKRNATMVFVTTAISQSGRLDTFTVLITQFRMIWQIAHLYYQRPTLREMVNLYSNVFATALIAGELNEIDISQQVEPVVTSVLGASLSSAIPGVNLVAGIVTNSLLSGAANAFLTLRIGVIAKRYCGSLSRVERSKLRKSASMEAARMLSIIVMNSAGNITKSIVNAAVKSPGRISRDVFRSTWDKLVGKSKIVPEISEGEEV